MAAIFIAPKLKQMCADAGYDGSSFFAGTSFVGMHGLRIAAAAVIAFGIVEIWAPFWRQHRKVFLGSVVFLLNLGVLASLVSLLVLGGIVGPSLGAKAGQAATAPK